MIRIHKPPAPASLVARGSEARAMLESAYDGGGRSFEFDRSVYADATVRQRLAAAQHGKCCFCESKVEHISDGDVEHFRPKAAVRQSRATQPEQPGYYWLAYEWDNLYFACQLCNQRNKQALFPLANPDARVRSHHEADQLGRERPLFIDPGVDDPERVLGYRDGEPHAIDGDQRAEQTRVALELGRSNLMERRWEKFRIVELCLAMLELARDGRVSVDELVHDLAAQLAAWTREDAEFTSMIRCAMRARLGASIRMPLTPEDLLVYVQGQPLPVD